MDRYHKTREAILDLNTKTSALLRETKNAIGNTSHSVEQWKLSCTNIHQNLVDHVVRIAVVGTIKSGKSTLVNTLLKNDYLKRGAGVVTSIVTRIRRGEKLKARLYFKSWDEINHDIEQAMVLFPSEDWPSDAKPFDIRDSNCRSELTAALSALDGDFKITKDSLNANSVLISSYLKGYDQVQHFVDERSTIQEFEADRFSSHREFVGEDALAVYLKDIQLEITSKSLETNIEMADCQGSDSPNPLHMAMIQDYLLKAHLIIYVISSRTGLRQADIRFLSIIKQMGIADNMLFVCNCDFNEHESLEDLTHLVQKVREELSMLAIDPQLFVFSALYHLFQKQQTKLTPRNKNRLEEWAQFSDLAAASDGDIHRLKNTLDQKLTRERSALLLQNQLERINVVHSGLLNRIRLNRELLKRDADDAKSIADRIHSHQGYMAQVKNMIGGTLDGNIQKINADLKNEIDRFFDRHSGQVLQNIAGFLRNYHVDFSRYRDRIEKGGFKQTLYFVFQEFKQAVDTYMAERINPEIIGFMGRLEEQLKDRFHTVVDPFGAMIQDAVLQYEKALIQLDMEQLPKRWEFDEGLDLEQIKQSMGLELPPAAAIMQYSARIKADAVLRLGFFTFMRAARKVIKKQVGEKGSEEIEALRGAVRRMKQETERSVYEHFRDYRENIKFQYMVRLVNAAGNHLLESLSEHFRTHVSDLQDMIASMGSERQDKKQVDKALDGVETNIRASAIQIKMLRHEIDHMRGG
jgi:GTPase SAR1 family protein/HAMP domain-containing protein